MIRIHNVTLRQATVRTRFPFHFGIAVMVELPHAFVQVDAEIDGVAAQGIAADHLPPKWFTKDPTRDPKEEVGDMVAVIRHAARAGQDIRAASVFAFWEELYLRQAAWGGGAGHPPLLYHFGTSLIERALIDAFCRRHQSPFHRLLQANAFAIRLEWIHPNLKGSAPADWLPRQPLDSVLCRHTVGMADPLDEGDIPQGSELDDGLPYSLAACIRRYGLRHFKIKINADRERSLARLGAIARIIERETGGDYAVSLDGNECFDTVGDFRGYWDAAMGIPDLRKFLGRLLFVEQPIRRQAALGEEVRETFASWPGRPPVIIDESDAEIESLGRAVACGYAGTSHKNCKGVFHGVANACFLAERRRSAAAGQWIMSGEDLTNIGPVALQQDLAVQAALGNESVERNGHHLFRGLSFWPAAIQEEALAHHPDLYEATSGGWPTVAIKGGRIALSTVNRAPFGAAVLPPVGAFPLL